MKKYLFSLLLVSLLGSAYAQRTTRTVTSVSSALRLSTPMDLIITGAEPFTESGSVDIAHDDAVVIIPAVKPSLVMRNYLRNVTVKGQQATRSSVWVAIYDNGAAIYPHPKESFTPLTVFEFPNYGGASRSDFRPWEFYNSAAALGGFENNIRSLKLKRGYMLTLACNTDGTGYSHVFIAQDADIEIPQLQNELAGRIGFIRIFPWNRVTKKGCGAFDWNPGNVLNVTWGYDWGAGSSPFYEDVDYVGMHHHEGWPSYSEIATARGFNTVLGNNEPDNLNDPSQNPIPAGQMETVLFGDHGLTGSWRQIYKGGYRVGSPAMAGDYNFLRQFIDLCLKYNYRIDFIATHRYQMGSGWDYDWFVNWIWDQYHLPVWITEWNYGAEWNGNLDQGPIFFRDQIAGITPILEANPHLERQAFFNVLGDANRMMMNRHENMRMMPAGEWYRDYRSPTAYTGGEGYIMKWNYWKPEDLNATYDKRQKAVTLNWINLNGKQTDSVRIERKRGDEQTWSVVARRGMDPEPRQSWSDNDIAGFTGVVSYRLRNFDSDGHMRISGTVDVSIGGAQAAGIFQVGRLTLTEAAAPVTVEFSQPFDQTPAVFMGPITNRNTRTTATELFPRGSITTTSLSYTPMPWAHQPNGTTTFTRNEEIPFVAAPLGRYRFADIDVEIGQLTVADTVAVTFTQPFPEGTVPIVIGCVSRVSQKDHAVLHKVWDVTPEGFKCVVSYEAGAPSPLTTKQQFSYMAVAPGQACIDEQQGILIAAGRGERPLYSTLCDETFTVARAGGLDTLCMKDPMLLAEIQTNNTPVATSVRMTTFTATTVSDPRFDGTYVTGVRLLRVLDKSTNATTAQIDNQATADQVGWVVIHQSDVYANADAVHDLSGRETPQSSIINHQLPTGIYDLGGHRIANFPLPKKGIYVVNGHKIVVK